MKRSLDLLRRLAMLMVLFGAITVAAPACLDSPAAPRFPDVDERPDDPERENENDEDG